MTASGADNSSDISVPANDNARAEAALKRFLLAVGVYVLFATLGWAAVGILVAHWIFE